MGFPKSYADPMHKKFGYYAVWEPNVRINVGDYGTVNGTGKNKNTINVIGNVADDFKSVKMTTVKSARADVESLMSKGTTVGKAKATGSDGASELSVEIGFGKKNSFLYHGSGMVVESIKNPQKFGQDLYRQKGWKRKWVVVTAVHHTERMTLLLCEEKNGSATVSGNSKLKSANLASVAAEASVEATSAAVANYSVPAACTPLARAYKLNRKGLRTLDSDEDEDGIMFMMPNTALEIDADTEFTEMGFDYCETSLTGADVLLVADDPEAET
ncbi:MAG: hypothetical protein AAGL89_05980 [Pseudomonadota bacterium]